VIPFDPQAAALIDDYGMDGAGEGSAAFVDRKETKQVLVRTRASESADSSHGSWLCQEV
jgi:hypothetical protein